MFGINFLFYVLQGMPFSSSQSPGQDKLQICDGAVGILPFQGTDSAAL